MVIFALQFPEFTDKNVTETNLSFDLFSLLP